MNVQICDLEISALLSSCGEPKLRELILVSQRFTVLGALCPGSETSLRCPVSLPLFPALKRGSNSFTEWDNEYESLSLGPLHFSRCSVAYETLTCRVFMTIKEARKDFLVLLFVGGSSQREPDFFT